jgi:hypothetical protein
MAHTERQAALAPRTGALGRHGVHAPPALIPADKVETVHQASQVCDACYKLLCHAWPCTVGILSQSFAADCTVRLASCAWHLGSKLCNLWHCAPPNLLPSTAVSSLRTHMQAGNCVADYEQCSLHPAFHKMCTCEPRGAPIGMTILPPGASKLHN